MERQDGQENSEQEHGQEPPAESDKVRSEDGSGRRGLPESARDTQRLKPSKEKEAREETANHGTVGDSYQTARGKNIPTVPLADIGKYISIEVLDSEGELTKALQHSFIRKVTNVEHKTRAAGAVRRSGGTQDNESSALKELLNKQREDEDPVNDLILGCAVIMLFAILAFWAVAFNLAYQMHAAGSDVQAASIVGAFAAVNTFGVVAELIRTRGTSV